MKKYLFILGVLVLGLASCSKNTPTPTTPPLVDAAAQAKIDDDAIVAYLAAHTDIVATKDASGLYYQILTPGTGEQITSASMVNVKYVGKTLNNVTFGTDDDFATGLAPSSNLIAGWKLGLPKLKNGGKILLIIPSALAYGPYAMGPIAANSVLIFTISVTAVNGTPAPAI
jgi:FKBP-type peptidyl-prolyl cis-trans isomerase FkpA